MLRTLHISNYVLIDSLEIDFPEGLVIITGQTGAGKSILLGALSLLMGGKADAAQISPSADTCVVEAEFDSDDVRLLPVLEENEVEWDNGHLIIRRTLSRTGRSRCFINDSPVRQEVLAKISSFLVDIHSQHQSLMLSDKSFQMSALDRFAGNSPLLDKCSSLWHSLRDAESELSKVEARLKELAQQSEYNKAQFSQLDAARLRAGELEELDAEQKTLSNAEEIKHGLQMALETISPSADASASMDVLLKEAQKSLLRIKAFMPGAEELASRIDSARLELSDISEELSSMDSSVVLSEERLQQVEERMSLLYDLFKKHGCRTVEELIEVREKYGSALFDSDALEAKRDELVSQIASLRKEYDAQAAALSRSRKEKAPEFAAEIMSSLHFLELDRSLFEVRVLPSQPSANGCDEVSFLFSSTGINPVDVAKCASGGEISRIMLSLKAMMARFAKMPTLVFDEIDTGVSGSVADKMGSMICSMGNDMQVFAITHLPQVAAKGAAHYLVTKKYEETSGLASSSIHRIEGDERVGEIARMLSGSEITAEAVANAKSLLQRK